MDSSESESQYATQINVKMSSQLKKGLDALFAAHGVAPPEIMRRLAQLAVDYEKETGEFPLRHLYLIKGEPLSPDPTKRNPQSHSPARVKTSRERGDSIQVSKGLNEATNADTDPSPRPFVGKKKGRA